MFKFWKKKSNKIQVEPEAGSLINAPGATLAITASVQSDVGCHREINEDCSAYVDPSDDVLVSARGRLVIVADGMGGHLAGEVASRMAVDVISRVYYQTPGDALAALRTSFTEANREIYQSSTEVQGRNGMGTTCTALVLRNGTALAAHVGDSRLYLIRGGQIYLMTEDHSAVMELVKRGLLTREQARHHPDKNVILRALGSHSEVEISIWDEPFPIRGGDRFLLCSDGLYDLVEDKEIMEVVLASDSRSACAGLITLAKERGGYDNITVAVVGIGVDGRTCGNNIRQTREAEAAV
ncbi:MAG TPA: Stp1/IreP family PP2C-type Ser/Thr phosphatase [Blastocatellia bacterium]|nr:Stp1/IreP family PP2C-type Ser/Thr phosphatase [Blastocatellia bacterium]